MTLYNKDYEIVMGLEIHAQLKTKTKLFSTSIANFGAEPNTQANAVDLAMPGMLPVLNTEAVTSAIKFGLAINAEIAPVSVFSRKNYFYPDLPKGYQISQFDLPTVGKGVLDVTLEDGSTKTIRIERAHLEEDAGKSVHDLGSNSVSHVDLNRAGVPLLEIVSFPDFRTPEEVAAYVKKLRAIVQYIDICDGDMSQGSMRCDVNVSVRKKGEHKLGTRREIKNVNSIKNIIKAITYEANHQVDIIENGGEVQQETILWDPDAGVTRSMRSKEDAHDYRYFPDPDILPLRISDERIEAIKATMPELPEQKKARLMADYELSAYDAEVITSSKETADFYEEVLEAGKDAKLCANWLIVELFAILNKQDLELHETPVSAKQLGELVGLIVDKTISGKIAKTVFEEMVATSKDPKVIVEEKGLVQITDTSAIEPIIDEVIASDLGQANAEKFRNGADRILGWFVGQVMQKTQGKANPAMVNEILKEKLK
ncbi:MAG TPA: Asp-tRNA(Asn)/Glu-tRNA(Gln) amidotransferase GatCAB subunit B [Alphaproteobacteria bacterium]|nr:Asp-tRNA(Asn)/Glu-tRNA(Gln) amidotransferase GatCAB subunit B [Alphaproteobacteria bacterium]